MDDRELLETKTGAETVFQGRIIHVEHWQVTLPNGETAMREIVVHPGASAVVALDDEGRLVLVRQHRVAVDRLTLEIPAGKMDKPGDDPFICAQRELSEETGLEADRWEKLTTLETTPGFCNERIHIYMAEGLREGAVHPDDDEFVSTERVPLTECVERVMRGEIRDGKTIVGIMMAARRQSI